MCPGLPAKVLSLLELQLNVPFTISGAPSNDVNKLTLQLKSPPTAWGTSLPCNVVRLLKEHYHKLKRRAKYWALSWDTARNTAQGNTKSTIGSAVAALGAVITVASIAALNSLDDIGEK